MGDWFYQFVRISGTPPLWLSARAVLLHQDRLPRDGPLILAANHTSPYDIPCLMRSTPRRLDFLSVVEMERKRFVGPFYRKMNCIFIDRQRRDLSAVRALRDRLGRNRAVAIFPESTIRTPEKSVIYGGSFKPGIVKLAQQTGAALQPCVVLNTEQYSKPAKWLPLRSWSYGINYGEPFTVSDGRLEFEAGLARLRASYLQLNEELSAALRVDTSNRRRIPSR